MDIRERELFEKYERQTSHRRLLKIVEFTARFGWVEMAIAFGILVLTDEAVAGYTLVVIAVSTLVVSLSIGVYADWVRKKIQAKVDADMKGP